MRGFRQLLDKFNGLDYRQEYLCLGKESFENPLHVYIVQNGKIFADITTQHCFVGYCPLIFALPSAIFDDEVPQNLVLAFCHRSVDRNDSWREKDAIATLILKKIEQGTIGENPASFYEGVKGEHQFISGFHQSVIRLNNRLYGKKPGNVFLGGNLYNQVQVAYAVPRKISLITVALNNLFNHFPTDLHGQINEHYYVISLRHEGNACKQVEAAGKIVLSDMDSKVYKKAYALGKNHMQPLKERHTFEFSGDSEVFLLPLAKEMITYKELELQESFIKGIHKIMLFRIVHMEQDVHDANTLAHVHNCYATWRNKQGFAGNYLLR